MPESPTKIFTQAPGVTPDLDAPRPTNDAPDPAAQRGHAGPFLQFLEFDASKRLWRGSVLFISDRRRTIDQPMLHIMTAVGPLGLAHMHCTSDGQHELICTAVGPLGLAQMHCTSDGQHELICTMPGKLACTHLLQRL